MICTTIQNKDLGQIVDLLENQPIQMAEIRLDRCPLTDDEIEYLFSASDTPLIATCRVAGDGRGTWREAEGKLSKAIASGAAFIDLEIEAPAPVGKKLRRECSEYGTVMIRSCHFFDGTPSFDELADVATRCSRFGGEIVKVVAMAGSQDDADRVLSLYDLDIPGRLVAFAMGEEGRESRLECLKYGAPFTYAAVSEEEAAAPGQWEYSRMAKAVYGDRTFLSPGEEPVRMPSSKSFAQRAIVAAALAEGESTLSGYSPCGDNESALEAARQIGAEASVDGSVLTIKGIAAKPGCLSLDKLMVGESGLLTRLMIPLLAALDSKDVTIEGIGTLPGRPLKGAGEIMAQFGTVLKSSNVVNGGIHVPLTVCGTLLPGHSEVSGKGGSQIISGLLMALPLLERDSTVMVNDPKSIPYMFITVDVLRKFGIRIGSEMEGDEEFLETQDWAHCTGIEFKTRGGQEYSGAAFDIEGDWSAAANFLVAGALFGKVQIDGLDTASLQADISIMDILMEAGASLSQMDEEEEIEDDSKTERKGMITVQRAPLRAFDTDLNNCPDLFPIVAVLAAFCNGISHIDGFRRLASKESDRGKAIVDMLTQMGVEVFAEGDTLTIGGETLESRILNGRLLKGGDYTSSHDHRMAMALTVAALGADSEIRIDDTACVAKSFPHFMDLFGTLA